MAHPATVEMLDNFRFDHLPEHLQEVSRQFHELAHRWVAELGESAETTAGLRKLLESKDCAVRCAVRKHRAEADTARITESGAPNGRSP